MGGRLLPALLEVAGHPLVSRQRPSWVKRLATREEELVTEEIGIHFSPHEQIGAPCQEITMLFLKVNNNYLRLVSSSTRLCN